MLPFVFVTLTSFKALSADTPTHAIPDTTPYIDSKPHRSGEMAAPQEHEKYLSLRGPLHHLNVFAGHS